MDTPYIFWFGFEDPKLEDRPDNSNVYFYQCLILAPSEDEAQRGGDTLTATFLAAGDAVRIETSWTERIALEAITANGLCPVAWEQLPGPDLPGHYHGTAALPAANQKNINALIRADSQEEARRLWEQYLRTHEPGYELETCSAWYVPVTRIDKGRLIIAILGNGSNATVQTTVPFALWCAAQHTRSYEDAIWLALEGQGDCDTIVRLSAV